ncbi:MAG: hypothetical protein OXH06_18730 [Gemmatimonadetes bacterium]|nr:hypothetical protein [Gemmatimonadota bacterium]
MVEADFRQIKSVYHAREIYRTVDISDLWMGEGDAGIRLFRGSVVENDSPGAGRSDDLDVDPFLEISGRLALKKKLVVRRNPAGPAQVAFIGRERRGHSATLRINVNGEDVLRPPSPLATPDARQYWELARDEGAWSWSRWYYVELPDGCLRRGENRLVFDVADGGVGWSLMVADYRDYVKGTPDPVVLPASSLVRRNGEWAHERGEYVIRLVLDGYRENGHAVSPVIDAAGEGEVKRRYAVRELRLDWDVELPAGAVVQCDVRTGQDPAVNVEGWTGWRTCERGSAVTRVAGRYLQWRMRLQTSDPACTPVLKAIRVLADVRPEGSEQPRLVSVENASIRRSSFWIANEDYRHDTLRELRDRFELDAVVSGAQTEFEAIERLMAWAYAVPLGACRHYPWDVLKWLTLDRDSSGAIVMNRYPERRRDKMCLYPNVALVAACLSFGYPARHVNFHSEGMTGHEIAEVWSNDYCKWVHLDATRDFYWYDPKTRVPLDTLEVHQVLANRLEDVERWDRPYLFRQDLDALVRDLPIAIREGSHEFSTREGAHFLFRSFCHFRMIPRSNVFSQPRPLPVSQGTEVWAWDGYLNWADEKVPPLPHFTRHTNRRSDFYPSMNRTRYTAVANEDGTALKVSLETQTPGFSGYLSSQDRDEWKPCHEAFDWQLHDGVNTMRVRSVNSAGVKGPVSSLAVAL